MRSTPRERIDDLLAAVEDVQGSEYRAAARWIQPTPHHEHLYASYLSDLRAARGIADAWWNRIVDTEVTHIGDRQEAELNVRLRRPVGPVAHPRVILVIRHYWLACMQLNRSLPETERIAPEVLLLLWLERFGESDLAAFLAGLPYWPMGMDEQENWI